MYQGLGQLQIDNFMQDVKALKDDDIRVRNTPVFKLKDRERRRFQAIHLKNQFGFVPEVIIIEKVMGMNNGLIIRAILTEEEKKKEDVRKSKLQIKDTTDGKSKSSTTSGEEKQS